MLSEIILIGILGLIPHLGYSIYCYIRNKHLIRGYIGRNSLYVVKNGRTLIGGIKVYDPQTLNEESAIEFTHKILDYLPLTIKLEKHRTQTALYLFPLDTNTRPTKKSKFEENVQRIAHLLENIFTPQKTQILTGRELYEKMDDEYGKVSVIRNEFYLYSRNNVSQVFELPPLCWDSNVDQCCFLLNCILELGVKISLSFTINMKTGHLFSAGQLRISDHKKEQVINALNILKKGGPLLLTSPNQNYHQKEFYHKMIASTLQNVPYLKRNITISDFTKLIRFCTHNASIQRLTFSTVENVSRAALLDNLAK